MDEINAALYSRFMGDATLTGQLPGGVHDTLAKQGTTGRRLIFQKIPVAQGVDSYTFGNNLVSRRLLYMVKIIDDVPMVAPSKQAAYTALARAHSTLTGTALTVSGYTVMNLRRTGDIDYPEPGDGVIHEHIGHTYEIEVKQA